MNYRLTNVSRTFYEVLGVPHDASTEQIRATHRKLAFVLHPDRQAGNSEGDRNLAERRMREINEAWTVLSNPENRAEYDRQIHYLKEREFESQRASQRAHVESSAGSSGGDASGATTHGVFDAEDLDPELQRLYSTAQHHSFSTGDGEMADAVIFDAADTDGGEPGLLRPGVFARVAVIGVLVIAFGLFVVTAYAGSVKDDDKPRVAKTDGVPVMVAGKTEVNGD